MQNAECKMRNERRLIDADALKRRFEKQAEADTERFGVYIPECFPADDANEIVDLMPTVDAVEVVRCEQCKRWVHTGKRAGKREEGQPIGCCEFAHYYRKANDFCSYGERREAHTDAK